MNEKYDKIVKHKNAFYLKFKRSINTGNGNGYAIYSLKWAWFKKRGSWQIYTKILGNGDNGERCQ